MDHSHSRVSPGLEIGGRSRGDFFPGGLQSIKGVPPRRRDQA